MDAVVVSQQLPRLGRGPGQISEPSAVAADSRQAEIPPLSKKSEFKGDLGAFERLDLQIRTSTGRQQDCQDR